MTDFLKGLVVKIFAIILIIIGLILFLTPLTPFSWIAIIGISLLFGVKRKKIIDYLKNLHKNYFQKNK